MGQLRHFDLIVFDLDDTLLDTTGELLHIANTPQYYDRIQKRLPALPGAIENLEWLATNYPLVLVTQGDPQVQNQKIQSLRVAQFFQKIYLINPQSGENKQDAFRKILNEFKLSPNRVLSIGNRRRTDIRLAKILGFKTCLLRYGEHINEPPELVEDNPDYEINSHQELIGQCQL